MDLKTKAAHAFGKLYKNIAQAQQKSLVIVEQTVEKESGQQYPRLVIKTEESNLEFIDDLLSQSVDWINQNSPILYNFGIEPHQWNQLDTRGKAEIADIIFTQANLMFFHWQILSPKLVSWYSNGNAIDSIPPSLDQLENFIGLLKIDHHQKQQTSDFLSFSKKILSHDYDESPLSIDPNQELERRPKIEAFQMMITEFFFDQSILKINNVLKNANLDEGLYIPRMVGGERISSSNIVNYTVLKNREYYSRRTILPSGETIEILDLIKDSIRRYLGI